MRKYSQQSNRAPLLASSLLTLGALMSPALHATENGGSVYPMGAENFLSGAVPPAGFYSLIYATHYSADDFNDRNGDSLPFDFSLDADVAADRMVWVTDRTFLGGQVVHSVLVPVVNLDVSVNGVNDSEQGVGDIIITPLALAYHHSEKVHSAFGLDIYLPTGDYSAGKLANIGRNYRALEAVYTASYINPTGINSDFKLMYDYNFENNDTDYRSGQELHVDYSLGYALNPNWVVGIGGYGYKQLTGDEVNGVDIGNEGQAFAIGPSIKFSNEKGFFITLKYQQEMAVENRPEGGAFWLKTIIPF